MKQAKPNVSAMHVILSVKSASVASSCEVLLFSLGVLVHNNKQ